MSSPVQPPLTVETIDGATVGRPITKIKVTNGTLSISGSTATLTISGGGGGSGTVTSVGTSQAFITITDPTTTPSISIGNASGAATGVLTAASFNIFDAKQDAITLTTTGTSGAATFVGGTLNIPQYSGTTGTVTGTGAANQVSYWTSSSEQDGSTGLTYDSSTGDLTVGGYVEVGTKITTPTGTDLTLDTDSGTDSGSIIIADGVNGQVSISANGTGAIKLGAATNPVTVSNVYTLPTAVTTDNGFVLTAQTDGSTAWSASGGGGGSPGGSDTELQYNDGGSFGGISSVTFNDTSNYLTIDPTRTIIGAGPAFDSGLTVTDDTNFRNSQTKFADGTAAAPSITFWNNGDDDTGIYRAAADTIGFTVGGNERMKVANDAITAISFQTNGTGTAAAPTYSFSSATNLGFFKDGSTAISFTSGGTRQMTFDANGVIRLGGSASNLSTYSNNLVLDTDLGSNSGSIVIEAGANGQISLTPDGTGKIKLDGVELDNTAIATGFVLKATSANAAGWAAESGGGSGDNGALTGVTATFASNSRYAIGKQIPLVTGSNSVVTTGFAYTDDGFLIPFIYPKDGAITEFGVTFGSTGGSGGIKVAVYTSDSDGIPSTLLARSDISDAGSGNTYSTTIVGPSSGSAATASKGDICWFAFTRFDGGTNTAAICGPSGNSGIVGPTSGPNATTPNCYRYTAYDASTTWPDTINNSTANAENNLRLCPTIKVA